MDVTRSAAEKVRRKGDTLSFRGVTIAIGAVFGGMNTIFSAVANRRREIGILRTVGYRPVAILASFLFESLLIGLLGGMLGGASSFVVARLPLKIPFLIDSSSCAARGSAVRPLHA